MAILFTNCRRTNKTDPSIVKISCQTVPVIQNLLFDDYYQPYVGGYKIAIE
jgi:hypothetical protein